jgi:UDP-N-acetyl-D-mannosaminuronate dehydrogenase
MSNGSHITDYTLPPEGREAAATKWNLHKYSPGLVGGHCIPVDPYYLVYKAKELGYHPQVILAGRAINDKLFCKQKPLQNF